MLHDLKRHVHFEDARRVGRLALDKSDELATGGGADPPLGLPAIQSGLEWAFRYLISESYKFIRMADDLHAVASHLSDIRLCFIALTVTAYLMLVAFLIRMCIRRNQRQVNSGRGSAAGGAVTTTAGATGGASSSQRRHYPHNNRTSHWDHQVGDEYLNAVTTTGQTDDLVSVRSDGQIGSGPPTVAQKTAYMMSRNHHRTTAAAAAAGTPLPSSASTMRHGIAHNLNHQPIADAPPSPLSTPSAAGTSPAVATRPVNSVGENSRYNLTGAGHTHHHHHQIPHIVTPTSSTKCLLAGGGGEAEALLPGTALINNNHHPTAGGSTESGTGQPMIGLRHHSHLHHTNNSPTSGSRTDVNTTGV